MMPFIVSGTAFISSELELDNPDDEVGSFGRFTVVIRRDAKKFENKNAHKYMKYFCKIWVKKNSLLSQYIVPGRLVEIRGYYIVDIIKKSAKEYDTYHWIYVDRDGLVFHSVCKLPELSSDEKEVDDFVENTSSNMDVW